ncbi:substrate-binding domain-containing protein [Nocardioides mangrovicus]|uniref:substrate-binding domain-containing protein n=1 Tax=Nocardioides mangrovicus TaxID=2478913 RepID=UPI00131480BD|nr:substrate-binding domain-containing protein [Nocardioides mangrovicus]
MNLRTRRAVAALSASAVALGTAAATVPAANADYSKSITIVGTSDVYDSGLMQYLQPIYEKDTGATYNYVSKGTGDAIAYAEAGTASVLLVHAASLENQFVAQGYSLEKFGRSVFWGDYVLAGPTSDPAGVAADSHDIVGALEKVAAAGNAGTADFVSRGNTAGTPVQEHQLWALANGTKCDISATNGGGQVPSTGSGTCNASGTGGSLPAWYHKTGLTQGPNITNASACNYGRGQDCYVFTDRGTFQYLQSTGQAQNMKILVRDNAAASRGNQAALVNAFHAYAINGSKVPAGNAVSRAGALKFLNWLTSSAGQKAVEGYLSTDSPFIPAASPEVSVGQVRTQVHRGAKLRFAGRVTNAIPGYPTLAKVNVKLIQVTGYGKHKKQKVVARKHTTRYGFYAISYKPKKTARYYVRVGPHTRVENRSLSPIFGDLLQAGTSQVMPVKVKR